MICVMYILWVLCGTFLTISFSFAVSTVFTKWVLTSLLNLDIQILDILITNNELFDKLEVLSNEINVLKSQNSQLSSDLLAARADIESIANDPKYFIQDETSSIKKTLVVIGLVVIVFFSGYFLTTSGSDSDGVYKAIKEVINHSSSSTNLTLTAVADFSTGLAKSIRHVNMQLQDVDANVKAIYSYLLDQDHK